MLVNYLFYHCTVFHPVYTYNPNSNLLRRVTDAGTGTPASANAPGFINGAPGLKDFKDGTNGGDDYTYDANGNITGDLNKQYTATYNLLDKPERILIQNNSMRDIRYVYDATGERLQKIVRHNDTVRTTTYIDGLTYHNDTTLLYFVNDGGRTRRNHRGRLVNDYYIDDHLGNVRMVLTDERDTTAYLAAFETNRDVVELATWRNRNTTRETIINTNQFFNNPNPNAQYSRLNGSDAARRQGPSLVLKVMAGDTFNVHTRALYNTPHSSVPNTSPLVNDMVNAAISAFLGAATGTLDNKSWLQTGSNNVLNTQDLATFLTNNQANNNTPNTGPRAYLKFLLFDENFKLVQGVAERIDNGPDAVHTYTLPQIVAPKNGFLYIYSSNESPVNVFFDDITVVHRTGPLLQESAFYPFGMEITPLSSYAAIKTPNQKDYQRNELDEEFGVDLHYFDARMYDAQVGRFMGVDPVMESYLKTNGFHYNFNNPLSFVDPDGREPISLAIAFKIGMKALFKFGKKVVAKSVSGASKGISKVASKTWSNLSFKSGWAGAGKSAGAYAGGGINVYNNWDKVKKSPWKLLTYFASGAAGSSVVGSYGDGGLFSGQFGAAAVGFGVTGAGNVLTEADNWSKMNITDFTKVFAKGGSTALTGAAIGKSFSSAFTGGASSLFSLNKVLYGTAESFSYSYGSHDGPINIGQIFGYAAGGFISSGLGDLTKGVLKNQIGASGFLSNLGSGIINDFSSNIMNYYVKNNFKDLNKIQLKNAIKGWGKSSTKGSIKGFFDVLGTIIGGIATWF